MREKTFVYLKPNTIQRQLVGEVLRRFERRGLKIVAMKMLWLSRKQAEELYKEHRGKDFYEPLIKFVTSSPIIAMVLEGDHAVKLVRHTIGSTDPMEASGGTIRGDFAISVRKNIVHASDSLESAKREIALFFDESEIFDYQLPLEEHF
ncbi:nucleoside diphosphate kinase [Kosmotoga arenicorallina S304]|uniref:Nucleoside diphosphate kinase n=1 Tax=Kosmotoga arenicorallina S304 TaxID=1453497 RepID=A0A176K1D8_9BACT|nr:nucleoside-diphosphate kinase [Kosmotoga arenicorallina]OAA30962.1 nucleoside diphosphate kinase [Kosmotoga arenicorallina S304]